LGIKKSCPQLVANYSKAELRGKLVLCVINLMPRQIGSAISEILVLGVPDKNNNCILAVPEREAEIGGKIY
jgi:tRNA-binding protein